MKKILSLVIGAIFVCAVSFASVTTYLDNAEIQDTLTFDSAAVVQRTKTFTFNFEKIQGQEGIPTRVEQGLFQGYSLPVFAADNEELLSCDCMPSDWDGVTDPVFAIGGWLSGIEDTKKFNMQMEFETYDIVNNAVVPATTNAYPVETDTGDAAQFKSFFVLFTVDASDIGLAAGQPLGFRIRRIAASEDEIDGEFVVEGCQMIYYANKIGTKLP